MGEQTSAKPPTYEPDEVEAKLKEHGLDDWYLDAVACPGRPREVR